MAEPGRRRSPLLRRGELVSVGLSFVCFFCILSGYNVIKPIRDALGVEGGVHNYALLFTGTFVFTLIAYPVLGAVASRTTRTRFAVGVFATFALGLLGFRVALATDLPEAHLSWAFFWWVSVWNVVLTSVFWGVMADVFSNADGRRLFGVVAAGGTAGAMLGPLMTRALVSVVGVEGMLVIAAVLVAIALLCTILLSLGRVGGAGGERRSDPVIGGRTLDGLERVARSAYLRSVAGYILLLTATATFAYFQQGWIVEQSLAGRTERTEFFATLDFATNLVTLLIQVAVTRVVARHLGVTGLLVCLPILTGLGFAVLGLAPTLAAFAVFQVLRRAADYGLSRPGREILFTLVSREDKFKAKNVVDVVVYRGGDAAVAWLTIGLTTAGLGVGGAALAALPFCGVWIVLARALGRMEARRRAETAPEKPT